MKKREIIDISDVEKDVQGKSNSEIKKKKKALKISIYEGSASSITEGLGLNYITPFADAVKATAFQVGLLSSLSGLAGPLAQLYGSKLMLKNSRKKIVLQFVLLQAIMWLPVALLAVFYLKGIFTEYIPILLIIAYSVGFVFGGFVTPAWFSWMGDLIPAKDRGRYFGARNTIIGVISLAAVLIGAAILDFTKTRGLLLIGFTVLFTVAFSSRFIAFLLLKKQYAPELKVEKGSYFTFRAFLKRMDNYGKFSIYQAFFNFAIMIASPFFTYYMLRELNFNYIQTMIITISSSVFYLIFLPVAGKFSDRFGNIRLLWIANLCFVLTPLLWLPSKSILWLIFIPQLVAGIANAALTIGVTNFTYDAVKPEHRGICLAYTNVLIGIGIFAGSILGGFLISYFHPASATISPYIFIFIVAAVARGLVGLIFLPRLKDERRVERLPPLHISVTHPFKSLHAEIGWFNSIFADKKGKVRNI